MTKKQTTKPTREERRKAIEVAFKRITEKKASKLLRDERQTYSQMVRELVDNPDAVSMEMPEEKKAVFPSCCRRRPAPSISDYEGSDKPKSSIEGSRSVDLSGHACVDPESVLEINREVARKTEIMAMAVESAIEDAPEKPGSGVHPAVPSCSKRNPTGFKRSTSLDTPTSPSPEDILLAGKDGEE